MTKLEAIVCLAKELEGRIPPWPWDPDIDDPGTHNEDFTGKFNHPGIPSATALYDNPTLARNIAEMRTIIHLLATTKFEP
jgi:hypothetical protein